MRKEKVKRHLKIVVGNLREDLLGMYYSSPLTFHQTRRQIYGLRVSPNSISVKRLYDTVERIRKQGWIEKKVVEDKVFYSLTAKGRIKQLEYKLRTFRREISNQSTIIIFDIPEEKRTFRNHLRRLLREMKFTTIQKSVLIAPYVLPKEFYDLLKEMDLLKFVKVIEGRLRF